MRYRPRLGKDFEWSSKSWTHNAFRVFELILGRKYGIRAESTCGVDGDGVSWVIVHSFEAALAYAETAIRNTFALPKFKFVKVYIPQLAYAGISVPTNTPYLFAIAFDVTANGTASGSTNVTWSHTCTGSNLTLTVQGCCNNGTLPTSVSATYNAVSVPNIKTDSNAAQNTFMNIGALGSPATGANNVVLTGNQTGVSGFSFSLTGTNAASPGGAVASSHTSSTTTASQAVTTTAANSWLVDNLQCNGSSRTATGTGQTSRTAFSGVNGNAFSGSTTTTTSIASYTVSYTWTGAADTTLIVGEIKAFPATANSGFFFAASR